MIVWAQYFYCVELVNLCKMPPPNSLVLKRFVTHSTWEPLLSTLAMHVVHMSIMKYIKNISEKETTRLLTNEALTTLVIKQHAQCLLSR